MLRAPPHGDASGARICDSVIEATHVPAWALLDRVGSASCGLDPLWAWCPRALAFAGVRPHSRLCNPRRNRKL